LRSPVSIAIVDAGGHLVLFERMMSPYGWATASISIAKATTAVMFNQSTDSVAQWGSGIPGFASSMATMTQGKFIMAAGGWPIRMGGATIGGIGVSGGNAPGRDDEIARAGLAAVPGAAEVIAPARPMQAAPQPQRRSSLQPMPSSSSMPLPPLQPSPPLQPPQAQGARELQGQEVRGTSYPQGAPLQRERENVATPYNASEEDSLYDDEISPIDQPDENRGGQS
jgi:uncharacterized protein GlcG (DUF336 family)